MPTPNEILPEKDKTFIITLIIVGAMIAAIFCSPYIGLAEKYVMALIAMGNLTVGYYIRGKVPTTG